MAGGEINPVHKVVRVSTERLHCRHLHPAQVTISEQSGSRTERESDIEPFG